MSFLTWPPAPTCHGPAPMLDGGPASWRPEYETESGPVPYRTCSYCGSIHPADLLTSLAAGATMNGSDWKYGWPHKHYVDIPNPEPEREWPTTVTFRDGERIVLRWSTRPTLHAKWYNAHLQDLITADFLRVAVVLEQATDIQWQRDPDGRVKFIAPYEGYQR